MVMVRLIGYKCIAKGRARKGCKTSGDGRGIEARMGKDTEEGKEGTRDRKGNGNQVYMWKG